MSLDVYCLIPYRPPALCTIAPKAEEALRNREIVFAFKNGRAMSKSYGGMPFDGLVNRIVGACKTSPLGIDARDTLSVSTIIDGEFCTVSVSKGYGDKLAAFCVAYDVDKRDAEVEHPLKRWQQIEWSPWWTRAKVVRKGQWGSQG